MLAGHSRLFAPPELELLSFRTLAERSVSLLGLLVTLVIAALVGWLADKIVPGDLPYGWLVADDFPWRDYRLGWIKMWPVLPGLVAYSLAIFAAR